MRIVNSTKWSDTFLRKMTLWCCKSLGLNIKHVSEAKFRNRTDGIFSGHAYTGRQTGRIVVSVINNEGPFPWSDDGKSIGIKGIVRTLNDRLEALVNVTAHELRHVQAIPETERTRRRKSIGSSERYTERDAQRVLELFRENRDELLALWYAEPVKSPKKTRAEKNEDNARKLLATWLRKLSLAKTKVSRYRTKVRRYDRIAANKVSNV